LGQFWEIAAVDSMDVLNDASERKLSEGMARVVHTASHSHRAGANISIPTGGSDHPVPSAWFSPSIAREFIGARGFVDIFHELAQLGGTIASGKSVLSYFEWSNLAHLLRAGLAFRFFLQDENGYAHVLLIAVYWARTLEVSFCEMLMRELLPITQLARSLGPSTVVCITAMCAFTHAKWVMHKKALWPDTIYDSFSLLITAGLPAQSAGNLDLVFAYGAVICFSVFFLNIFIGVLSEVYAAEKARVALNFQKQKCGHCLAFLTRAQVLPGRLLSAHALPVVLLLTWAVMTANIVWRCLSTHSDNHQIFSFVVLVICQMVGLLVCYQDTDNRWSRPSRGHRLADKPRYLWMASPVEQLEPSASTSMEQQIQEMRGEVQVLKELIKSKTFRSRTPATPCSAN